ncbi:FG-GAP repeat protein [Thiolapillus sp.]|uniref:FG-GAP repeat protein n=2 Tax=Thiolapillus sp. TaxID=2017437 RepID=UPI003AF59CC8
MKTSFSFPTFFCLCLVMALLFSTTASGYDALLVGAHGEDVHDIDGAAAEAGDEFGEVLSVGDYNGSASGLLTSTGQKWHQSLTGAGFTEANDHFGRELSSGDFNGDGCDDLAIGTPNEGIESVHWAGAINILYCNSTDGCQQPGFLAGNAPGR